MIARFLICIMLGCAHVAASGQGKANAYVHEGDRLFAQMAYAPAKEAYKAAVELGAVNEHVTKRLAECNMRLGDTEEAERWYATVVKFLNREPRDLYYYAEALKSNGRYNEAEEWMDRYLAMVATEGTPRRSNISGFARKLSQDADRFVVRPAGINTPYSDFGAAWLGDDRVIFASSRNFTVGIQRRAAWNDQPFLDLYVAQRGNGGELSMATPLDGAVNSKLHEGPATASRSGDALWFTRNNPEKGRSPDGQGGVNRLGIHSARPQGNGWGDVRPFTFNNPDISVGHPALSPDGRSLYFASDMPGGLGGTDIYVCHDQGGEWSEPENLGPSVNTPYNEVFPFISASGTIYFSSNGHPGLGGLDVLAAKPLSGGGFKTAVNVGAPVNGPKDDFGFIIDAQEKHGYFSSNRPGGMGDDDIYAFEMLAPLEERFLVSGTVIDDEYETPVIGGEVLLADLDGRVLAATFTDARGEYSFPIEKDRAYKVMAIMTGRFNGERHLSTENVEREQIITRDIHLVVNSGVWMRGAVSHKNGPGFIEGMHVSVVNLSSYFTEDRTTGPGGDFNIRLQTNEEFEVIFEKEGYFSQSVPVSTIGMREGVIDLNEARDLTFERMVLDSAFRFEHVRWTGSGVDLDPVARAELDLLVERMLVNPALVIEVGVHTDASGAEGTQVPITQKRADAIAAYLTGKGVPGARVVPKGYGNTRPLNHCVAGVVCSPEEHAVNRRSEYRVVEIKP